MDVRDVQRAFTRKLGAVEDRKRHHIFFFYQDGDFTYEVGKLSHSWSGNLNDAQEGMLARKLQLQKRQFVEFVDCSLSTEDMVAIWRSGRPEY